MLLVNLVTIFYPSVNQIILIGPSVVDTPWVIQDKQWIEVGLKWISTSERQMRSLPEA